MLIPIAMPTDTCARDGIGATAISSVSIVIITRKASFLISWPPFLDDTNLFPKPHWAVRGLNVPDQVLILRKWNGEQSAGRAIAAGTKRDFLVRLVQVRRHARRWSNTIDHAI